jgi:HlyD family secretion protein
MATKKRLGLLPIAVLVALGGAGFAASQMGLFESEEGKKIEGVSVLRGTLRISEPVKGNLEARNSIKLRSELERETTILFLIEEGEIVEANALVCELDVAEMIDRQVDQEGAVNDAQAALTKATEAYAIQEIQNLTDKAEASLKQRFAEMDLDKYQVEDGEWTNELAEAEESIALAREELAKTEKEYTLTETLVNKDFAPAKDLEDAALAKQSATIALARREREKRLKERYEHVRRLEELQESVATAKRDVEKTEKQSKARLADLEAGRSSSQNRLAREEEKLLKLIDQIGKGKIYAPEGGMVVYARQRSRWGNGDPMDEGVSVRERQDIVTIPRPGGMVAEASLHETSLRKVRPGQRCIVRVDALPGQTFEGEVTHVAVLPDSNGWMSDPNQRTYKSEITMVNGTLEMRPGMSCAIEILIEDLDDVLYLPKQCVFLEGRETVAYVNTGEEIDRRVVEVGSDNRNYVVVEEGLEEGDLVLPSRPASFQPQPGATGPPGPADGMSGVEADPNARPVGGGAPGGGYPSRAGSNTGAGGQRRGRPGGGGRPGGARGEGDRRGGAAGGGAPAGGGGGGRQGGGSVKAGVPEKDGIAVEVKTGSKLDDSAPTGGQE